MAKCNQLTALPFKGLNLIRLAVCKAGACSACLSVTKMVLIEFVLYYKFKQFTNISMHILLNNYVTL